MKFLVVVTPPSIYQKTIHEMGMINSKDVSVLDGRSELLIMMRHCHIEHELQQYNKYSYMYTYIRIQ